MAARTQRDPFAGVEPSPVTTDGPAAPADGLQDRLDGDAIAKLADTAIRTRHQAHVWAFGQVRAGLPIYHELCLMFTRLCPNVGPLYPDARTARLEAVHFHRESDPDKVPNGKPVHFATSSDHDHVAWAIGNGKCVSSDTDRERPGTVNVVRIQAICDAWGAKLLGWADDINGEDVPAPRPRPRVSDRAWRIRMLRSAIQRARSAGQLHRVARLRKWLRALRKMR